VAARRRLVLACLVRAGLTLPFSFEAFFLAAGPVALSGSEPTGKEQAPDLAAAVARTRRLLRFPLEPFVACSVRPVSYAVGPDG